MYPQFHQKMQVMISPGTTYRLMEANFIKAAASFSEVIGWNLGIVATTQKAVGGYLL